jgi:hypothetical protein
MARRPGTADFLECSNDSVFQVASWRLIRVSDDQTITSGRE